MSGAATQNVEASTSKDEYAGFLTPLQQSLVYELTTRRDEIKRLERRAAFWEEEEKKRQEQQAASGSSRQTQFSAEVLDEAWYDEQLEKKAQELQRKLEAVALKNAIVASADAAHAINASMAAVPPAPPNTSSDISKTSLPLHMYPVPRAQQPLRSIVAHRDALALHFLQVDQDIKEVKKRRQRVRDDISSIRKETSATLSEVSAIRADTEAKREAATTSATGKDHTARHERIAELETAVSTARGKREMVKGVLRGLILESGLDWMGNDDLCKLMLALGDDGLDASDEEDDEFLFGDRDALAEEDEDSGDETMHP